MMVSALRTEVKIVLIIRVILHLAFCILHYAFCISPVRLQVVEPVIFSI